MKKKRSSAVKTAALSVAAIATSLLIGMSAACSNTETPSDKNDDKVTTKQDSQEIKNGNFEFYDDNDGLYPISTPDSWTGATSGNSSASMSGVIKTDKKSWDYITDATLPKTLEDNDDLDSDDENKKNYNGALTDDLPFKNPHEATKSSADEDDREYIANPFTHKYSYNEAGKVIGNDGKEVTTYEDEDGKLFLDQDLKEELDTSVLMLHNYRKSYYTGTETNYKSSTTLTLEANTACKISVWVKTSDLYVDDAKGERSEVTCERGAYIKVDSSIGGNALDSFKIRNINTEQLNKGKDTVENNGWIEYTVYVEASTFAETTVNLTLGLGENDGGGVYTVEGYAFFDDITFEKYINIGELTEKNSSFATEIRANDTEEAPANTSYPLAPDAKTEFRVDTFKGTTNDGGNVVDRTDNFNSADRSFFIDFASSTKDNAITLDADNVSAGLTVQETSTGKYVASKNNDDALRQDVGKLENGAASAYLSNKLKGNGLDIASDFIATLKITDDFGWTLPVETPYKDKLTGALKSAASLPGVQNETSALVMLSAWGAPYEANITDAGFEIADGEYVLASFWLKTSDFNSKTAATVTVVDAEDKSNSANFTIDTTTQIKTTIGDQKDVYDGWVRCFVRVANTSKSETAKKFIIKVNIGSTSIKGTSSTDYQNGWVAVANPSIIKLDEDVYGYTSGLANTASLTFTETKTTSLNSFDTEQGDKNEIKTDLAIPSSYTGANGASISVAPTGKDALEYDKTNANAYAGLLNKNNLDNYKDKEWFTKLSKLAGLEGLTNDQIWNKLAGEYTVQPLLIVNTVRKFDEVSKIYNYGYIGNSSSVSANGYAAVSVRVKASAGAVAYVYLVDSTTEGNEVLSYKTPAYSFWYDDNGNILKGEPKENASKAEKQENIAYTLRGDGLYENGDGKLYANLYNLSKYYDYRFEHEEFFDENGNKVAFENLVTGKTYYADAAKTKLAPHHLVAGNDGNNKIYEYVSGVGEAATYYYMENGVANTNKTVTAIDRSKAATRYENLTSSDYMFVVDGAKYPDKWVTVTFNIKAGSQAKNYRLELWSGKRDEQSSYSSTDDSYVMFDYSSATLDATKYDNSLSYYTDEIIADYKEKITEELPDNEQSIAELEKLAGAKSDLYNYDATYYTFSLYDSSAFIPFNGETAAENQSGYSYNYSDYEESLAFLKLEDATDENNISMTAFIDYSVVDKDIEIIGAPVVDDDHDHDHGDETQPNDGTNAWLLAASIALVVAIFAAAIAIFLRDFIKKHKRKKTSGKNTYNFNKNKRYVRKYVKANGDAPIADNTPAEDEATTEEPATEEAPEQKPEGDSDNAKPE